MNQSIRNLLSITLVLPLWCAPMFAQYHASSTTRTSVSQSSSYNSNKNVNVNQTKNVNVNQNTNVNVNKNTNVNVNKNTNVNVNQNVNVNVNKSVNVSGGYYGGACCYHPAPVGAAVVATAMVTAAIIGSRVYALPPACSAVYVNGFTYQHCGSTWYQPQFVGTSPSYVVVVAPR